VLDTVSGDAIGTETLRYGQRVTVVALPAAPILLTPKGCSTWARAPSATTSTSARSSDDMNTGDLGPTVERRSPAKPLRRRIGIDVGGTNTDAVLLDGERVVAAVKTPTTADVTGGRDARAVRAAGNGALSHLETGHPRSEPGWRTPRQQSVPS